MDGLHSQFPSSIPSGIGNAILTSFGISVFVLPDGSANRVLIRHYGVTKIPMIKVRAPVNEGLNSVTVVVLRLE
eukprot:6985518-Karenia_brevis.AAC.1